MPPRLRATGRTGPLPVASAASAAACQLLAQHRVDGRAVAVIADHVGKELRADRVEQCLAAVLEVGRDHLHDRVLADAGAKVGDGDGRRPATAEHRLLPATQAQVGAATPLGRDDGHVPAALRDLGLDPRDVAFQSSRGLVGAMHEEERAAWRRWRRALRAAPWLSSAGQAAGSRCGGRSDRRRLDRRGQERVARHVAARQLQPQALLALAHGPMVIGREQRLHHAREGLEDPLLRGDGPVVGDASSAVRGRPRPPARA